MGRASIPKKLLDEVKNYLNITWDDEATDRKVRGLIASGQVYLDTKLGGPGDYNADGLPRTLLFEYVRYMRDGALEVFENNFQSLLLGMQNERAVRRYAQAPPAESG